MEPQRQAGSTCCCPRLNGTSQQLKGSPLPSSLPSHRDWSGETTPYQTHLSEVTSVGRLDVPKSVQTIERSDPRIARFRQNARQDPRQRRCGNLAGNDLVHLKVAVLSESTNWLLSGRKRSKSRSHLALSTELRCTEKPPFVLVRSAAETDQITLLRRSPNGEPVDWGASINQGR